MAAKKNGKKTGTNGTKNAKKKFPEARERGGFKSSRHGDGKRKASAAGPGVGLLAVLFTCHLSACVG